MLSVITLIVVLAIVVLLVLKFKHLTGKVKPAEQRSALEKIACSIFVKARAQAEDAARSIRTARVMKTEALQEVNDALANLQSSYKSNMISLKTALKTMEEQTLPRLKDTPGKLEARARKSKKDYEASVEKGTPIEAYKANAIKYLQHKNKALEDIKRAEKTVEKLTITIETAKATYEGQKVDLEMLKADLESVVDIPQIELTESLNRIRSLQSELNNRMNQDNITAEVNNELINEDQSSAAYSSDVEDEFNKL